MGSNRDAEFSLGAFEVHPLDGMIIGPAGKDHLQPKVMDVLVRLAETPGELVTRAELCRDVWGTEHVSDDALTRCVSELRHHLEDQADHPRYIQTVPKRGYRLIARVERREKPELPEPKAAAEPGFSLLADLKRRRVFRVVLAYAVVAWLLLQVADVTFDALNLPQWSMTLVTILFVLGFPLAAALGWALQVTDAGVVVDHQSGKGLARSSVGAIASLVVIAVIVSGGLVYYLGPPDWPISGNDAPGDTLAGNHDLPQPPVFESSIAVLPFLNLSSDPGNEYIGFGIADELIHRLTVLNVIRVAARTSSFAINPSGADVPAIAAQLQVDAVLEGSIRLEENKLRVLAQLIDSNGFHMWSESFDRDVDQLLDVQSEIALAVASRISTSLTPDSEIRLAEKPTDSIEAYDLYLRARDYLRRPRSDQVLSSARDLLTNATAIDPRFAEAHAGICETFLNWFELDKNPSNFEQAEAACHRARTLDDRLAVTYLALGQLYRVSGQLEKAEDEFLRGLELQPGAVAGYEQLGRTYHAMNKTDSAEKMLQTAVLLAPGDWNTHKSLGNFLYRTGRYQEAIESYTRVVTLSPDNAPGYNNLAAAYYMLDDFGSAASNWAKSLELAPSRSAFLNTGAAYYFTGEYENAEKALLEALKIASDDFRIWGRLGAVQRHMAGKESQSAESFKRARELAQNDLEINPDNDVALRYSALFSVRIGNHAEADELLQQALQQTPVNPDTDLIAALVNLELGREQLALDNLERGIQNGLSVRLVQAEPDFLPLKGVERFERLTAPN